MTGDLTGKRVLVTGAATGIGKATAQSFIQHGADVVVHARSEEKIKPVVEEISAKEGKCHIACADLESDSEIEALCFKTLEILGGIDIVVNNAGISVKAPLAETSDELWDRTMQVNLKAPFLIARHLVPEMSVNSKGGRLIFISSVAAKLPDPVGSAYNTSKAALLGLVRCLAAELGVKGITVNAICPGWVDTPMARQLHMDMYDGNADEFNEFYRQSISSNMLNTEIKPEDIANCAVYLGSDKARNITAQMINVCAGICYS